MNTLLGELKSSRIKLKKNKANRISITRLRQPPVKYFACILKRWRCAGRCRLNIQELPKDPRTNQCTITLTGEQESCLLRAAMHRSPTADRRKENGPATHKTPSVFLFLWTQLGTTFMKWLKILGMNQKKKWTWKDLIKIFLNPGIPRHLQ